ncbi:hypothetical protein SCP_0905080 [Sparassis crispa]|uniref:Uncharacterized protein n=1 Tax=Sparassis crispa TaxID=139825 RepID=A0A401GWT1_9APHY|nr:hypothetical protein SCP_0905080 [Sparassis crispa]GBE86629.1 hypothetical protein SCP_0905080 [Sparassis crispa]
MAQPSTPRPPDGPYSSPPAPPMRRSSLDRVHQMSALYVNIDASIHPRTPNVARRNPFPEYFKTPHPFLAPSVASRLYATHTPPSLSTASAMHS